MSLLHSSRPPYALGTNVPRDTGGYAEKLYVTLRCQFPGKSEYLMACRNGPFGSLGSIYVWHLCSFVLICQIIAYYNVYMYAYILTLSIPRTSSARNMHHGAQSSTQGTCCQDIGFRHMFSAPDCVAFGGMHVSCG